MEQTMRHFAIALAAVALGVLLVLAAPVDPHALLASFSAQPIDLLTAGMLPLAAGLRSSAAIPDFAVFMEARSVEEMQAEREELVAASQAIVDAADEAGEDVSDENMAIVTENQTQVVALDKQIGIRLQLAAQQTPPGPGRRTTAEPQNRDPNDPNGNRRVPATARDTARGGFRSFGHQAHAIRQHALGNLDNEDVRKLMAAATTYGTEGTGADGGFAVMPEFRREIWQKVAEDDNLMMRTDQLVTGSNSMTFPKDESTPWQSSGGVLAYWESEAGAITQSKPQLQMSTLRLNKLTALVPMSEELLDDAPGMESYLRAKAPTKMRAKLNTSIIRGTGAGQPLGILNAGSLISVAAEQSQAADTVLYANLSKMWNRLYGPLRRNAVWLINQDIEPQLDVMEFSPGSTVPIPVYLPAGGLSASPYATLKGRPVIPVEACSTLGDKGDVILTSLDQYMTLTKGQDIKTDVSIHLFFDQALTAFRFIFRVAGQPWWGSTISPENGTVTRSWAVTLDERAG
jgi:HK97 family phage major capsid protein